MKKLRHVLAVIACKLLIKLGVLMGKKGSSLPGSVAMKIAPDILRTLSKQIKKEIVLVCGTNGKTTTNNLIYSLMKKDGNGVVCNNVGANMLPGVACAFISKANIWGKLSADTASIECDEASVRHIVKHITPQKIVVTNLFRDQSDRYGEIENTAMLLKEAFDKVPEAVLVLNADDPYSTELGKGRKCIYFGVSENALDDANGESPLSPICANPLRYEYHLYNQLGKYACSKCDFERPNPNYSATRVCREDGLEFVLSYKGEQHKLSVNYRGFYNIYNILASFAVFESMGGSIYTAREVFDEYKPQLGRMEEFTIEGKKVILNLAKNPAGFNQAISTVMSDNRTKNILVAVNDMPSDGTDISWLWDTEFEKLNSDTVASVYAGGTRQDDLALRLKYADVSTASMTTLTEDDIKKFIRESGEVCYLVVNYTVLFGLQSILKALEDK